MIKIFNKELIISEIKFFVPENWNSVSEINSVVFFYNNILYSK